MTKPLSPSERKLLKSRAHPLSPVVIVGNAGLTASVQKEIEVCLKAHELIKIRVIGDDRDARQALLGEICNRTGAAPVQHIGKILVLFRENPELHSPAPKRPGMTGRSPGKLKR
jgi:RNA-binding protein